MRKRTDAILASGAQSNFLPGAESPTGIETESGRRSHMKLLVVILNYRTPMLVIDCLRSLGPQLQALGDCRVSLLDGNSPDDSVLQLRSAIDENGWGSWVDFRPLPVNGGFAYGNNRGIVSYLASHGAPALVLLLNPDTVVRDGAVEALVRHMEEHRHVGIAGSRLEDPDGTPQRSAFRFPGIASEIAYGGGFGRFATHLRNCQLALPVTDEAVAVDWVAGASMIVRREIFDSIGLLDERYFLYYEEVDFCLRAQRAGFRCEYVPASRVVHLVGRASGVTGPGDATRRRPAYWFESRRRFYTKNYGWMYRIASDGAFAISLGLNRIRQAVLRTPATLPSHMWRDHVYHSALRRRRA